MTNILARQNFPKCGKRDQLAKIVLAARPGLAKTAGTQ